LTIRERVELFVQVCEGVQYAHQKAVIHRDLKPSNVLVTVKSNRAIPKIIDFGIAKATDQRLTDNSFATSLGQIVGTPAYMSPEQVDVSSEDIDTRTDIYSLGVLLYELLAGSLPFDFTTATPADFGEIQRKIREDEPPKPSTKLGRLGHDARTTAKSRDTEVRTLLRQVRGDLDWITLRALEKDRTRRYDSASELAADLVRHLNDEPVQAGPPSTSYRLKKYVQRNRRFLTAVGAVVLVLLLGLLTTRWFWVQSGDRLVQLLGLADNVRLEQYETRAEELWPAVPDKIAGMEAWLTDANPLKERLDSHRDSLQELRKRALPRDSRSAPWAFAAHQAQWEHGQLTMLVEGLERLSCPDPHESAVESVKRRIEFARTVVQRSLVDHEREWTSAVVSIANPEECPVYGGMKISPQLGLVPLGRDPASGLREFAHLASGSLAKRQTYGTLELTEASGLVFVLIPAGTFWMGGESVGLVGSMTPTGFVVREVLKASVAERAGFQTGDSVVTVNNVRLEGESSWREAQRKMSPGDTVTVEVVRENGKRTLSWTCAHYFDPDAEKDESPRREVPVQAMFLSKFEMT
jgi:hypothetical protein